MRKNILILMTLVAFTLSASASKPNVNRAKSLIFTTETTPNIDGAKAIIEEAIEHPETKDLAKTWYVAAEVYLEIARIAVGQDADIQKGKDAMRAYDFLLKAQELDQMPNKKGKVKPKYSKKIVDMFVNNIYNRYYLVNYGVSEYNKQNFGPAKDAFIKHLEIANIPMVKESKTPIAKDSAYNEILFFSGHYSKAAGDTLQALKIFTSMKDLNYKSNEVYQNISIIHKELNDTSEYEAILKEGIEKFPREFFFLGSLINFYALETGRLEYAISYLEQAIANNPNDAKYYSVMGSLLAETKQYDKAIEAANKAVKLDPNNHEAWAGLARYNYMKGTDWDTKAGAEHDLKIADTYIAEADKCVLAAEPFFIKAIELMPDNIDYLKLLRSIYYRFYDDKPEFEAKYNEINKKIKELGY